MGESGLPRITLTVNGIDVPALLDTGSPITVLNPAAATVAVLELPGTLDAVKNAGNPFAKMAANREASQAAARGDVLTIMGATGPVQLEKANAATVTIGGAD